MIHFSIFIVIISESVFASGAYDKGTATGKGRFELSLTINPLDLIPYGQNYGILSYGVSNKVDIVAYYSKHNNGTRSQYIGGLFQFINSKKIDLATAIGIRNIDNQRWDVFFPQLLYNYKLPYGFSIGGSIVKVVEKNNVIVDKGNAIDISVYVPLKNIVKQNSRIKEAYFAIGTFKNTKTSFLDDKPYIHYSLDIIF